MLQCLGAQCPDGAPRLAEAGAGHLPGLLQPPHRGLGGDAGVRAGGLRQRHDAREALRQGVVYLPRQPLSLCQHARPAFGSGQLAACRLQLFEQPSALLALLVNRLHHRDEQGQRDRHRAVEDQVERLEAGTDPLSGHDQQAHGRNPRRRAAERRRGRGTPDDRR